MRPTDVMAGLVPAIHAAPWQTTFDVDDGVWAWMAGTSPAMTRRGSKGWSNATEFCSADSSATTEGGDFRLLILSTETILALRLILIS
jgi:hypothetical protein